MESQVNVIKFAKIGAGLIPKVFSTPGVLLICYKKTRAGFLHF